VEDINEYQMIRSEAAAQLTNKYHRNMKVSWRNENIAGVEKLSGRNWAS
jgi:hypothetical protein